MSELPERRPEDATIAALDDDAAVFSQLAGSIAIIAAHNPKREIRQELRKMLRDIQTAKEVRRAGRAAYAKVRGK